LIHSQAHKKRAVILLNGLTALSQNLHGVKNDVDLKNSGLQESL
jgi:hypothetical protein